MVAFPLPDALPSTDAAAGADLSEPLDAAPDGSDPDAPDASLSAHHILFVGNSFTFYNDLEAVWAGLHQAFAPEVSVDSRRVASAGYRLEQHLGEATGADSVAPIRELLVTQPPAWDYVVLQEQSQIPGFPPGGAEHDASVQAAVALSALADAAGARTLLFETWGYKDGDPGNPALFPDYATMQTRLSEGYAEMAAAVQAAGHPVDVLPAGQAFRAVYSAAAVGADSLHARLYSADGRHPSPLGTYLVACTLAALLSPEHRVGTQWAPAGVTAEDAAALRAAAESLWE